MDLFRLFFQNGSQEVFLDYLIHITNLELISPFENNKPVSFTDSSKIINSSEPCNSVYLFISIAFQKWRKNRKEVSQSEDFTSP